MNLVDYSQANGVAFHPSALVIQLLLAVGAFVSAGVPLVLCWFLVRKLFAFLRTGAPSSVSGSDDPWVAGDGGMWLPQEYTYGTDYTKAYGSEPDGEGYVLHTDAGSLRVSAQEYQGIRRQWGWE